MKTIMTPYGKIYGYKESGRLFIKDRTKETSESKPIKFGAYINHNEPMYLWDYMKIRGIELKEAIDELLQIDAVLIGNRFEVCFYEEEDFEKMREFF